MDQRLAFSQNECPSWRECNCQAWIENESNVKTHRTRWELSPGRPRPSPRSTTAAIAVIDPVCTLRWTRRVSTARVLVLTSTIFFFADVSYVYLLYHSVESQEKYDWRLTRITILTAIITSATADPPSHTEIGAKMRANSSMLLMEKNYEIIFGNWTIGTSNTFDTHPESTVYASNSLRKGYLEPKVKLSLSVNSNFKTYTADDECYDLP